MNLPQYEPLIEGVVQAMKLARTVQSVFSLEDSLTKKDRSPVTIADFAVQALIIRILQRVFPDQTIVAEEDSACLKDPANHLLTERICEFLSPYLGDMSGDQLFSWIDGGRGHPGEAFWTLDPIDGTKGFLRGEQFAIALALIRDHRVEAGIIGCPSLTQLNEETSEEGFLVTAVRGNGARAYSLSSGRFFDLHVSSKVQPELLQMIESYESSHSDFSTRQGVQEYLRILPAPKQMDGQVKYVLVAGGDSDIYLRIPHPSSADYREKIWDHAAGMCIIDEAGGRVTDILGRPLDFSRGKTLEENRGILATNGFVHEDLLDAISRFYSE